jgi:hypothetical protein
LVCDQRMQVPSGLNCNDLPPAFLMPAILQEYTGYTRQNCSTSIIISFLSSET